MKRRVARGGGGVGRGAALQQLLHDVDLPQPTGDVQRRLVVLPVERSSPLAVLHIVSVSAVGWQEPLTNLGLGLHFGSVLQQVSHHIRLAGSGCHVKGRLTSLEHGEINKSMKKERHRNVSLC